MKKGLMLSTLIVLIIIFASAVIIGIFIVNILDLDFLNKLW